MNSLDPRIRTVWRIRYALSGVPVILAALAFDLARFIGGNGWWAPGLLSFAAILLGTMLIWFVPRLRYAAWHYELREEELYVEYGVVTHVRTVVPLRRVQHLDVSRGLLEREFGLARFIVHTAGTRANVVVLPGLAVEDATRLHDEVKKFLLERTT